MVLSMGIERGAFTAVDFRRRAETRSRSLASAADVARLDAIMRGDDDLDAGRAPRTAVRDDLRLAGVLIGIVEREPGATVILTLRASHLSVHAGQIAFPGGRIDTRDRTVIDAAVREAGEEIGLLPGEVELVGLLDPYRTNSGFHVVPVLSIVSPGFVAKTDANEVAEVFEVPLEFLMNAANHQRHSVDWEGRRRHFYAMPYRDRYIWGATAGILRAMYERLYAE